MTERLLESAIDRMYKLLQENTSDETPMNADDVASLLNPIQQEQEKQERKKRLATGNPSGIGEIFPLHKEAITTNYNHVSKVINYPGSVPSYQFPEFDVPAEKVIPGMPAIRVISLE